MEIKKISFIVPVPYFKGAPNPDYNFYPGNILYLLYSRFAEFLLFYYVLLLTYIFMLLEFHFPVLLTFFLTLSFFFYVFVSSLQFCPLLKSMFSRLYLADCKTFSETLRREEDHFCIVINLRFI